MDERRKRASGCLFGLAIGDALAAQIAFSHEADGGDTDLEDLVGTPARVSDDTQLMLAVGEALATVAGSDYSATALEPALRHAFIAWLGIVDNGRVPGMTCLNACAALQAGLPWQAASVMNAKGSGANMRVAPVGLLPVDPPLRAAIAQFQAALTHGHPTALAASDLTAFAIAALASGVASSDLPLSLRDYANTQRNVYPTDWLGDLWQRSDDATPEAFIARGWDECLTQLDRLDEALAAQSFRDHAPCPLIGRGWSADDVLANALLCFLRDPDDPISAVQQAASLHRDAETTGGSDSIACLTGAFAGARHGLAAWPDDWVQRIEYRERLTTLGGRWDR